MENSQFNTELLIDYKREDYLLFGRITNYMDTSRLNFHK